MGVQLKGPLTLEDLPVFLDYAMEWVNNPEINEKLTKLDHIISREEETTYAKILLQSPTDKMYLIVNERGETIGHVGIHEIHENSARLGIVIGSKKHHGKGYATMAIDAIAAKAFDELRLEHLYMTIFPENTVMMNLALRLGYAEEEQLPNHYKDKDGRLRNMVKMGLKKR